MSTDATTERLRRARQLMVDGDPAKAIDAADEIIADTSDAEERVWALLLRLTAVVALERTTEYTSTVDRAYAAVRRHGDTVASGFFHALAAYTSHADGSIERCVTHLVRSTRALSSVDIASRSTAVAWHNLAVVYSYIGFHEHAAQAAARARELAAEAELNWQLPTLEVPVRQGLSLDHRGDTDGCVRVLRTLLTNATYIPQGPDGLPGIAPMDLPWLGFAAARLNALGHETPIEARRCLAAGYNDAWSADLRHYGRVCLNIAAGETDKARQRLTRATSTAAVLGAAEAARLKALSYVNDGDYQAAWRADREAFAIHARIDDQLRRLFVDGVATRLDHEDLRRTVASYGDRALTDPLTGLPNRRHLQEYVDDQNASGQAGVLGVLDLDGFRQVNTTHGRLSGDTILQRTAGALMRVMRRGDFVARYGADEFALVLQGTPIDQTGDISRRITNALDDEDWESLVPGYQPRVNIGWTTLDIQRNPERDPQNLSIADVAVTKAKRARQSSQLT
ncbi:GGDEF domain-containing protein [Stackebrandtia nassauensis]|uniref:Diguanylate cyclase n=1 Tax=Stackebrandtia nassauensis (strain DSM 44728 / CIP 108903 / NRRL B-16338 / NBRC 102104 / LLR-40K-21) TaxID=446470 RepID=D3PU68_STANL|nr:GGDEF domain-containing protein [Stackebrandtia nassauensis]ADD41014.1 diguanylate cyclase [Stackebrandtia nassauensis DSM 44728]